MEEPKTRMIAAGDLQPRASATPLAGTITQWHDAKGYGWIDSGGKRVFAHIKDFGSGQRRPVAGDEVTFTAGTDEQGRPRGAENPPASSELPVPFRAWR